MNTLIGIVIVIIVTFLLTQVLITEIKDLKEYDPKEVRKELIKVHKVINELKRGSHASHKCRMIKGEDK